MPNRFGDDAPQPVAGSNRFGDAAPTPAQPEQSFGAALREYGAKMNPITALQGLGQTIEHPIEAIKGLAAQNERLAQDAETAFKEKRYADAARHASNYLLNMIPGLGTQSDEAGNKLASGDVAGGLADTAALATQTALGIKTPAIAQGVARGVSATAAGLKAAAPNVIAGGTKIAAGELLGKVPGMEWPARLGLGYPGARQIAKGLQAGVGAARADLFPPPLAPLTPSTTIPWSQIIEQAGVKEPAALPAEVQQELTRPSEPAPVAPTVPQAAPTATVPPETPPQASQAPVPAKGEPFATQARGLRAASAETLSQALSDAGKSAADVRPVRVWDWPKIANEVGVDFPVTHSARLKLIRDTLGQLEKKEATAPKAAAPSSAPFQMPTPIAPEPIRSPIETTLASPEPSPPPTAAPAPATSPSGFQYKGFLATLGDADRENLFSVMREYGNKAQSFAEQHAKLRPNYGELAVGGAHIDPLIKQYAIEAVSREIGRGASIEDAITAGKQEAALTAENFNKRLGKSPMAYQIMRPTGMADSMLDEYGRRLRKAIGK